VQLQKVAYKSGWREYIINDFKSFFICISVNFNVIIIDDSKLFGTNINLSISSKFIINGCRYSVHVLVQIILQILIYIIYYCFKVSNFIL
jgi:hypothetical protein